MPDCKSKLLGAILSIVLMITLTACGTPPRVMAQQRTFLNISLEFLGEYELPKMNFKDTPVGGISAITYDPRKSRFFALSDDRSKFAPARFYTLNIIFDRPSNDKVRIDRVEIEDVTFLTNERGETFPPGTIDPEGIALSPRETLFVSSEGVPSSNVAPFIGEFDLKTGKQLQTLNVPSSFLPKPVDKTREEAVGVRENLGFEALTLNPNSLAKADPFRLFAATESSLSQDFSAEAPEKEDRIRMLHYNINPVGPSFLLAEHLYLLAPDSDTTQYHGLSELTALAREGYFLTLERRLDLSGFGAKIFQMIVGDATDISQVASLRGNLNRIQTVKKSLLLDLEELGIELDNLEGMTLGPRLPDGTQSLILASDDNFKDSQITQFLLFRLASN